jgi:hypothetical protein
LDSIIFHSQRAPHIFFHAPQNTKRLHIADRYEPRRRAKERGESLLLGEPARGLLLLQQHSVACPLCTPIACAAVEKISKKERKNGRSLHVHIQVRAFIFLILPVFPCAWFKKSASSDSDVLLNGLVLKKCPVCVISEEIWSKQEIWAPTNMSTETHGCYRASTERG